MTILLLALAVTLGYIAGRIAEHLRHVGLVCDHCKQPVTDCACFVWTPEDDT